MSFRSLTLTGEQIRAARALARIEQAELARRCGLSLETIKRLERIRGPADANIRTLNAINEAFRQMSITFESCQEGSVGVCRASGQVGAHRASGGAPPRRAQEPGLHRLIYHSVAKPSAMAAMRETLGQIVVAGRQRNEALGVTGVLFACDGQFLQVLEGGKEAVQQVYGAICSDPRHTSVQIIENRPVASRHFPDWSLCCGRFASDEAVFENEPAMADGCRFETLSPASALGLLSVLRDLQEASPRSERAEAGDCALAGDCLDSNCAGAKNALRNTIHAAE